MKKPTPLPTQAETPSSPPDESLIQSLLPAFIAPEFPKRNEIEGFGRNY